MDGWMDKQVEGWWTENVARRSKTENKGKGCSLGVLLGQLDMTASLRKNRMVKEEKMDGKLMRPAANRFLHAGYGCRC